MGGRSLLAKSRRARTLVVVLVWLGGLAVGGATMAEASPSLFGGTTRTFPYRQKRLLFSHQGPCALVHVPNGAPEGATLPVLVFLHGQNAEQRMHPRFDGGPDDLRKIAQELTAQGKTEPFLIAAPTHTRYATGASVMWHAFDVRSFLEATDVALAGRAKIDRSRVVVVGHSAAGCNPRTGVFAAASFPGVRAVVAVDTCLTEPIRDAYLALGATTDLRIFWNAAWARPFPELERECKNPSHPCRVTEVTNLSPASAPHEAVLGEALRRVLPELFPAILPRSVPVHPAFPTDPRVASEVAALPDGPRVASVIPVRP